MVRQLAIWRWAEIGVFSCRYCSTFVATVITTSDGKVEDHSLCCLSNGLSVHGVRVYWLFDDQSIHVPYCRSLSFKWPVLKWGSTVGSSLRLPSKSFFEIADVMWCVVLPTFEVNVFSSPYILRNSPENITIAVSSRLRHKTHIEQEPRYKQLTDRHRKYKKTDNRHEYNENE